MPFVLIFLAALFITVGYNGCEKELFALLKSDFTGQNNYLIWIAAIIGIGFIGYVPKMKGLSEGFLLLIIVAIAISHRGVFDPTTGFLGQLRSGSS